MSDEKKRTDPQIWNGAPYAPDVDRLMTRFGVPEEGTIIRYEEIEEALMIPRKRSRKTTAGLVIEDNPRFVGVVGSWRKKLQREYRVVTDNVKGAGYIVRSNPGKCQSARNDFYASAKKARQGAQKLACVDRMRLDEREAKDYDQQCQFSAQLDVVLKDKKREDRIRDAMRKALGEK